MWNPSELYSTGPHLWGFLLTSGSCSLLDRGSAMVVIPKQRKTAPNIGILTPKPMPAPTNNSELKKLKKQARPTSLIRAIAAGCCSGLCLLCYLEAWHSTRVPVAEHQGSCGETFLPTWLFPRCPSHLGQALRPGWSYSSVYAHSHCPQRFGDQAPCVTPCLFTSVFLLARQVVILPVFEFHLNQMATPKALKSLVLWHIESRGLDHWWTE